MDPKQQVKLLIYGAAALVAVIFIMGSSFTIPPGHRGVMVTMGKVAPVFAPEGFGFKAPFITDVLPISIRQQTKSTEADCYSSDLQQIKIELRILYRIPENMIVRNFQDYSGDPFDSLVAPRVA